MSEAEDVAFKEMFPLVIGLLAGLAVFFIVIAKIIAATTVETTYTPPGMTTDEAISERVAPIGRVNMEGPMLAAADAGGAGDAAAESDDEPRSAGEIYSGVCAACHDNGVAGAPELGDTGTWQSRLDERGGYDALYENALNGIGAMPARGGASLSEEELDEVVRYILEESGISP